MISAGIEFRNGIVSLTVNALIIKIDVASEFYFRFKYLRNFLQNIGELTIKAGRLNILYKTFFIFTNIKGYANY